MNFIKGSIQFQEGYFFVPELNTFRLSLDERQSESLKHYVGKAVLIGIRPEHILISEKNGDEPAPDCSLEIVAYENMGNEQFVYLSLGLQTLIIRRLPLESTEVGREKDIRFLRNKIIYFDESSGQVIH
jgi:ABC-type sugar transport system ATPase subunit